MPGWYARREQSLKILGFPDYRTYLGSELWRKIRRRVLEKAGGRCRTCKTAPATQVHHRSYCVPVMRGDRDGFLVAVCGPCHEAAEFRDGRKVGPREANARLNEIREANARLNEIREAAARLRRDSAVLCVACKKNMPRRGRTTCQTCLGEPAKTPGPPKPQPQPAKPLFKVWFLTPKGLVRNQHNRADTADLAAADVLTKNPGSTLLKVKVRTGRGAKKRK